MVHEAAISAAIIDLKSQAAPNYAATAKKFNIDRNTLQRRFESQTTSNSMAHIESQGLLDTAQERVLIECINKLSARGLPPTPGIIENLVQEFIKRPVGKHWVSRLIQRHKNEPASVYLDNIDYTRRIADNSRHFNHYLLDFGNQGDSPQNGRMQSEVLSRCSHD